MAAVRALDESYHFAMRTATLEAAALAKAAENATPTSVAVAVMQAYMAARACLCPCGSATQAFPVRANVAAADAEGTTHAAQPNEASHAA
jgi:hypothetical protein